MFAARVEAPRKTFCNIGTDISLTQSAILNPLELSQKVGYLLYFSSGS